MKNDFEAFFEREIPEINILTSAGASIEPGSILESQKKDIEIGYLPNYLKGIPPFDVGNLPVEDDPYSIQIKDLSGTTSEDGVLNIMNALGLEFNKNLTYKISLDIEEVSSKKFANNIGKIDFENAIEMLVKKNKSLFKKIKNHYLVTRTIYAKSFKVTVEVEKGGKFVADNELGGIEFKGSANIQKKSNAILVSNNNDVPFGVICFKIKRGKLKEKD